MNEAVKRKLDSLIDNNPIEDKKFINRRKDGLIERVRAESSKQILTEDNKTLLMD